MSTVTQSSTREHRVTVHTLARAKREGRPFSMLTAYDHAFARIFDKAGIDVLLVGDSLGMVVQGYETTLPVTLDEMVYHTRLVARGARARDGGRRPAVRLATRRRPRTRCAARSGWSRKAARRR